MQPIPRPSSENYKYGSRCSRRNPELERRVTNQKLFRKVLKNKDKLNKLNKRSAKSKAWAIATHPLTALKYKLHGQDIPENFEEGKLTL